MSYKRPLYLLPCKSTIILIKRNILGDNYWVLGVRFWVVSVGWWWIVVMGDEGWGRILAFDSFELWRGWWCQRKGGIITAYIRVFFIIKLLSLLTFRVTLLWVNGLDKVIAWQIWQESFFLFFTYRWLPVLLQGVLLLRGGLFLFCFLISSALLCLLCLWGNDSWFVPPYIL